MTTLLNFLAYTDRDAEREAVTRDFPCCGGVVGQNGVLIWPNPGSGETVSSPPYQERWLYETADALASVRRGLEQAAAGDFADPPPALRLDRRARQKH